MNYLVKICTTVVLGAILAACSSSDDDGSKADDDTSGTGDGQGGGGIIFGDDSPGPSLSGAECAAESAATEAAPLDIYIMFDQSCSMSCPPELAGPGQCCLGDPRPRIDQVRSAVRQFLDSPDSAGIGVGIGYFGYFPLGATSCNPRDYQAPAVPIASLPQNAQAVTQSLNRITPVGETPTGAAIRGACAYARSWKQNNAAHAVVQLVVTDGVPEAPVSSCNPTLPDAEQAARECASGEVPIPTYILGVGANLENLNRLAAAGGTEEAYLVGGSADVTQSVLEALQSIRDAASVPCDFRIPPRPSGEPLNPAYVNVSYETVGGGEKLVPGVSDMSACGADGGWYYDSPTSPSLVQLCPASCDRVTIALIAGAVTGQTNHINITYGCKRVETTR